MTFDVRVGFLARSIYTGIDDLNSFQVYRYHGLIDPDVPAGIALKKYFSLGGALDRKYKGRLIHYR